MTIYNQNSFVYGEVGNKLAGYRDSEIARSSAKVLRNIIIEETGIPIVAKKYQESHTLASRILNVVETSFNYNIMATSTTLYLVNKDNSSTYTSIAHGLTVGASTYIDLTVLDKETLVVTVKGQTPKFFTITDSNTIATKDFFSDLLYPVEFKQDVEIDLVQVGKVDATDPTKTQMAYIQLAMRNPKIATDGSGNATLVGTNIAINRWYTSYKSPLDGSDFNGLTDGMVIAIFRNVEEVSGSKQYNIGNLPVTFGSVTYDTKYKGNYFTKFNGANAKGEFIYGILEDIKNFHCSAVFQDRFVVAIENKIYYSKIGEYNNFRNDILNDSSFNIKPRSINNNSPDILRMISSEGLYLVSNRGIYISGYTGIVTPANNGLIQIISDIPATTECEIIDKNFFYLSNKKELKCVQRLIVSTGAVDFQVVNVEKYSTKNFITHITKTTIDDNDYLVASQVGVDQVLLYQAMNEPNLFRRTTLDFDHTGKTIGLRDTLMEDTKIYSITENNYDEVEIFFNVPPITTKTGGSYMNDLASRVSRVVIRLLNEDGEAVEGMYINEEPLVNLGESVRDITSTYSARTSFKIEDGFTARIITKGNDKALEFQGIDMYIEIKND